MAKASALQELEKALKGQQPEAAWRALAQAWGQSRAPELLEVTRLLQAAFPAAPFAGDHTAWLKAAQKPSYVERGALLAGMRTTRLQEMAERMQAVAAWSPDPRTSLWVEQLVRDAPFTSDSSKKTWKDAFALLVALGEPRFVALVPEAEKAWAMRDNMKGWLGNQLRQTVAPLAKLPAPDLASADAKVVAGLRKRLASAAPTAPTPKSASEERGLLAAVYASPDDDAPRAAYAAYLTQAGDPRGEFITLSLLAKPSPEQKKRKAELVKIHGARWLGALAPAIFRREYRFDRGFLSEIAVELTDPKLWKQLELVDDWRTLKSIHFYWENEGRIGQLSEGMHGIKEVIGLGDKGMRAALASKQPWAVEDLNASMEWPTWQRFAASKLFPNLKRLATRTSDFPKGASIPVPRGLQEIQFHYLDDKVYRRFLVDAEKTDLQTIRYDGIHTRDARGRFTVLDKIVWSFSWDTGFKVLKQQVQGWVTDLTIRVSENNGGWRLQQQDEHAQQAEAWCSKQKWLERYRVIKQKAMR